MDDLGARTIRELIDRMAASRGDAPFLIVPETGTTLTYRGLRDRARALAMRLAGLGLTKGRKVAFLLDNGPFFVEALLGSFYAGLVAVPLSAQAGPARLREALEHSDAELVFAAPGHLTLLEGKPSEHPRPRVMTADGDSGPAWGEGPPPEVALPEIRDDDDALVAYTSGTTGRPKAPLFSHLAVLASAANIATAYALQPADRALCVRPLAHGGGQNTMLLAPFLSGGSVVLPRRFDVTAFWDVMVRHRCTWVGLVPTMIAELLNRAEPPPCSEALAHVRCARSSATALAPVLHREFEARFGLPLLEAMGATEAGSVVFTNPLPPAPRKVGSVGLPVGFEVRVVDDAGRALPAGRPGDVLLRGRSIMKGYYKDPAMTAEALAPDGWLRTGDVGYRDDDGYVFLVGRAGDLINKAGVKVPPREIEEILARHPAVFEAAVVGVPDPYLGQEVIAFVVPRVGARCRREELSALCEEALGAFKVPARIHVVDELPRTPSGKVQRHRLIESASRDVAAPVGRPRPPAGAGPGEPIEPRTPVERVILDAWREVLGRDGFGVHDDFFALGGGSLAAIRILARLARVLPVGLGFGAFVESPTIAEQAALVLRELLLRDQAGEEAALRLVDEIGRLPAEEVARRLSTQDATTAD